ncbi:MAG: hypothetical protein ABIO70_25610 [Pseudomonadota bacterium]
MTSPKAPSPAVRAAALHARVRWVGVGLFLAGILTLGGALTGLLLGHGQLGDPFIALFSCGLGLGTFGAHNDTALAILRDRRWQEPAPPALAAEIDAEVLFNRLDLSEIQATPKTAWVLTALAPLALCWAILRLVL